MILRVSHTLQSARESAKGARIVHIYFSTAFDRVNHQGILKKVCSVGIGSPGESILTQFISNRSQHVMLDSCQSKLVNVASGVPQSRVLGPSLFLLVHLGGFFHTGNTLIGDADD